MHKDIVCFTMELNQHQQNNKKNAFEIPVSKNNYVNSSSNNKKVGRVVTTNHRSMSFQLGKEYDGQYLKKLKSYLDFLFKINFSNHIYVSLDLHDDAANSIKYKAYIGKGNNSLLIKGLLKRRFWWEIVQSNDQEDLHFCWTQNIVEKIHHRQKLAMTVIKP